jgi:glycosyltransferase involved in cell wall biosynthesis
MKNSITVNMIVKNESKSILKTLNSIKDFADILVVMDTGSEDDTIAKIEKFCNRVNMKLYLTHGQFINFGQARNDALMFAESWDNVDGYILMLDANDELREGGYLRKLIKDGQLTDNGYYINQDWQTNDEHSLYINIKLIKARTGWYWKGRIHETLYNDNEEKIKNLEKLTVVIYQNRNEYCESSGRRMKRDIDILLEEYCNPDTELDLPYYGRVLYYLGQTYFALSVMEEEGSEKKIHYQQESLIHFKERMSVDTHMEELYTSCEMCGDLATLLNHDRQEIIAWYLKCLEYQTRAEPLIKISMNYFLSGYFVLSYMFIGFACRLDEPKDILMYYNKRIYTYTRWYLLAVACLEIGKHNIEIFKAGIDALSIVRDCPDKDVKEDADYKNLLETYKGIAYQLKEDYYAKTFDPDYVDPDKVARDEITENGVTTYKIGY